MSWRLNQELRAAKLAGLLPKLEFTEFAVLLIITDTCRSESRVASISMTELAKLSGQERTQMWRDITRLIDLGLLKRVGRRGNQHQANRYEILLPRAGCTDATSTDSSDGDAGCTDATSDGEVLVASSEVLVASDEVLVASEASAGCTHATHPDIPVTIPTEIPVAARETDDVVDDLLNVVPFKLRRSQISQQDPITEAFNEALDSGMNQDHIIEVIQSWLIERNPTPPLLRSQLTQARRTA